MINFSKINENSKSLSMKEKAKRYDLLYDEITYTDSIIKDVHGDFDKFLLLFLSRLKGKIL